MLIIIQAQHLNLSLALFANLIYFDSFNGLMPDKGANDIWDEFQKEVDQGKATCCDKLDPTLMRNVIDFSRRLKKSHTISIIFT
jgi:hypothetical protein